MESSDEDLVLDLVFYSSPFPMNTSSKEGSFTLGERKRITEGESRTVELFDGNSFGLAPENMTRLEGLEQNKKQKDGKHLSRKTMAKLSDEKLEKMSTRDLNKQLRQLSEELVQKYRKRRRILKNRKYALKCRRRVSEKRNSIAEQNAALELEICRAKEELRKVTSERDEYKQKYVRLKTMFSAISKTHCYGAVQKSF